MPVDGVFFYQQTFETIRVNRVGYRVYSDIKLNFTPRYYKSLALLTLPRPLVLVYRNWKLRKVLLSAVITDLAPL